MRFWNAEVNTEIEDVLAAIYAALPVSLVARLGGCAAKGLSLGAATAPVSPVPGEKLQQIVETPVTGFQPVKPRFRSEPRPVLSRM